MQQLRELRHDAVETRYLGVRLEREGARGVRGGQDHLALVGPIAVGRQAQGSLHLHALQSALSSKLRRLGQMF